MRGVCVCEALVRLARKARGARWASAFVEECVRALEAEEGALWVRSGRTWRALGSYRSERVWRGHGVPIVPACALHRGACVLRLDGDGAGRLSVLAGDGPGWLLLAPVLGRKALLAVRMGSGRRPREALGVARVMAAHASVILESRARHAALKRRADTDGLTGAMTYRAMLGALRRSVRRARRRGATFSVLMADLDHLKEYNERNGHLRGSDLLRRVAGVVRGAVRPGDIVSKYGGDEFVLILPDTKACVGWTIGERVCAAVAGRGFPGAARGSVTLSIGLAQFPDDGTTAEALLRAADRALFAAKRMGRNRVQAASLAA